MKFILLSDLHLMWDTPIARQDNILETQMTKVEFILDWANRNNCPVLQAGDFFDKPRSWLLLPKIIALLKEKKTTIYSCFGQHDMYMYSEGTKNSTSLGVLNSTGLVKELDGNGRGIFDPSGTMEPFGNMVFIYGSSWGTEVPKVKNKDAFNILVTHRSIGTEALFPGHEYKDAQRFLRRHTDYNVILVGDIHRKFIIEKRDRYILNTGCMLRSTAEEYNFQHTPGFFVLDTATCSCEWAEIPHEHANIVLSREHIEQAKILNTKLDDFLNSFSGEFTVEVSLYDNIQKIIRETETKQEIIDILSKVMGGAL